ncbi:MAG: FtsK/SpoIIIE domain-containing protein [Bdellovibrionota bacterium]
MAHKSAFDHFADKTWNFLGVATQISFFGLKKLKFKSFEFWLSFLISVGSIEVAIILLNKFLKETLMSVDNLMVQILARKVLSWPYWLQTLLLALAIGVLYSLVRGFKDFKLYSRFQKAIERTGLKNAQGDVPKIKSIETNAENQMKIVIESMGVGLSKVESQKDSLTAGFRQTVDRIQLNKDKGKIDIFLVKEELPQRIGFYDLYKNIKEPYSFIVGQGLQGPIVQPIRSLPHLLISGATGGGKSVFFRSTILSLLKSSPHIQMYLLDLKRGVEVKEFASLPNVKTCKDEKEAIHFLSLLVAEMNRRYIFLENKGLKSIDPQRDHLDLIIVGIDEAAALFGKKTNEIARKHIAELARLARASGIHLIPSTQKPVKEAIDTETLDNLPGRMTFRMISSAASNVAMGGNFAKKLPAIKGRAVWTHGSEHCEVQAPFIDDNILEAELKSIKNEFDQGIRKNFQELLKIEDNDKPLPATEKSNQKDVN